MPEAVAAIDGAVSPWLEGHGGILAAFGADNGVHFPSASIKASTAVALGTPILTAARAALWLVCEASFGMVRLIVGAEGEWLTALYTRESSVLVIQ